MGGTFVGFGFGPIQAGLFALEAFRSAQFSRLVVAEVAPDLVAAVRAARGVCAVNIAGRDGIAVERIEGLELLDPGVPADADRLVEAIADAGELATALPSVSFFERGHPCVADLLARGLAVKLADAARPAAVLYAGENHNHAAELLEQAVLARLPEARRPRTAGRLQFLNTVIGKMSGVVSDPAQIARARLAPLAPGWPRAYRLEAFNRILVSAVHIPGFRRGIGAFVEKANLLPFEEAKLYGHNAAHALLGCLAHRKGCAAMSEAAADTGLMRFVRDAFLEESGVALSRRHAGLDGLFTLEGYRRYADDLLERMTNPWLEDAVARVIRDPRRKLGWDDRFAGTMRLALDAGIAPVRFAAGAAVALDLLAAEAHTPREALLDSLWPEPEDHPGRKAELRSLILTAGA